MTPKKMAIRIVNVLSRKKRLEFDLIALGAVVGDVVETLKRYYGIGFDDNETEIPVPMVDAGHHVLAALVGLALEESEGVSELYAMDDEISDDLQRIFAVRD
jgi:hypothetical protein